MQEKKKYMDDNDIFENYDTNDSHYSDDLDEVILGLDTRQYCTLMHLSQFAGYILLPVVMWLAFRDKNTMIDQHGKNIVNWLISLTIYLTVAAIASILVIGIPVLIVLGICAFIFPIIGAIKAHDGEMYKYKWTIDFIK